MTCLNTRERELVALGAALASNCVPCIEYHIPESRKAGLTEAEIFAALQVADKVRQVPAKKVLETALKLLPTAAETAKDTTTGCAAQTIDTMSKMMSNMMSCCGNSAPQSCADMPGMMPSGIKGCGCG
jgi:AhpD family alkylhydroperoxidase